VYKSKFERFVKEVDASALELSTVAQEKDLVSTGLFLPYLRSVLARTMAGVGDISPKTLIVQTNKRQRVMFDDVDGTEKKPARKEFVLSRELKAGIARCPGEVKALLSELDKKAETKQWELVKPVIDAIEEVWNEEKNAVTTQPPSKTEIAATASAPTVPAPMNDDDDLLSSAATAATSHD